MSNNDATVQHSGWCGALAAFLRLPEDSWLDALHIHHRACMNQDAEPEQITAWRDAYQVPHTQLSLLIEKRPHCASWTVVFEYELPRERGRRIDVVVLAPSAVLVCEFKRAAQSRQAYVDQVAAYARDLRAYHAASHDRIVVPLLILTSSAAASTTCDGVAIVAPHNLARALAYFGDRTEGPPIDPDAWLGAEYAPLPTLVDAARRIFANEPLPTIRRAASSGVSDAVDLLLKIAQHAQEHHQRHLVFLTGVPGSGKTLVGLQLVHHRAMTFGNRRDAVLLSRNAPLVYVLQHVLQSTVFVQGMHGFLKQYGGPSQRVPEEHLWIYDEGQRALNASRVRRQRGHETSEPEDFIRLGNRMPGWACVVVLVGEGQEIYYNEPGGASLWNEAIAAQQQPWVVHCPARFAPEFPAARKVHARPTLDLTVSLRSHLAEDVHTWVNQLLDGHINQAAQGLELDFAVIEWGRDIYWKDGEWRCNLASTEGDARQLRLNSYRVFFTRGRDGFVLILSTVFKHRGLLIRAGLRPLPSMSDVPE